MKKIIGFLATFFIAMNYTLPQEVSMNLVKRIIDETKTKFAPDKRTSVFNIEVDNNSNQLILIGETDLPLAVNELTNKLHSEKIVFQNKIITLPSKELGEVTFGIINLSVANIRTKPNHPEELATQALLGTPVKILKKESGFYLIQTPDEYIAWVDDDGLTPTDKSQIKEWTDSDKIIYLKEYGFSYKLADNSSERVSDLTAGNILKLAGTQGEYYKVVYPDGRIAFVEKSYCEIFDSWINNINANEKNIISTAKSFMGVPYLWGGTSAKGMDCSGFTKTVYFLNGIVLPRDASQQVYCGDLIDTINGFENLLPGDLLFFGLAKTDSTKERITHVGIYIGNKEFIHAAGRVKINSFDKAASNFSEFRLTHFIRAKRILNTSDKNNFSLVSENNYYNGEFK